jgi:hypothetical protein
MTGATVGPTFHGAYFFHHRRNPMLYDAVETTCDRIAE